MRTIVVVTAAAVLSLAAGGTALAATDGATSGISARPAVATPADDHGVDPAGHDAKDDRVTGVDDGHHNRGRHGGRDGSGHH
jgi:hypothetical protein